LPPGIYFRLLLIGYFEGIDSERGIAWRAADLLALRVFLGLDRHDAPPEHSTISRTARLDRKRKKKALSDLASHGCGGQLRVVRLSEDRINQPIECHMCSVGCQEAAASLAGPGPKQRYRGDHCLK
jgi:transposase